MARPLRVFEMQQGDTSGQLQKCRLSESYPSESEIRARLDEIHGKANSVTLPLWNQSLMRLSPLVVSFVRLVPLFTLVFFDIIVGPGG